MLTTKHVISVEPSRCQQGILLAGHLLAAALLWEVLRDGYAACFFGLWLLSLGWSLYRARRCRFTLELQGNRLAWQAESYTLGAASRVAPGFLWLALEGKSRQRLWLWADSVSSADYRRLARHINLLAEP